LVTMRRSLQAVIPTHLVNPAGFAPGAKAPEIVVALYAALKGRSSIGFRGRSSTIALKRVYVRRLLSSALVHQYHNFAEGLIRFQSGMGLGNLFEFKRAVDVRL